MIGAPALGGGGLAGWQILKRTGAVQRTLVARDPVVVRNTDYFKSKITQVQSAEDLVKDYRLMSVALGAFGLEADIGNRGLIRKVLEANLDDGQSLVNRMTDKRYRKLAEAFQLDIGTRTIRAAGFADKIIAQFNTREFERRIGENHPDLRLALNAQRELAGMGARTSSDKTLWYEVMGNPPLRKVFETALGMGSSYGRLPVERQLQEFMGKAEKVLGSASFKAYATPEGSEKMIRTYLLRSQMQSGITGQSAYQNALELLR